MCTCHLHSIECVLWHVNANFARWKVLVHEHCRTLHNGRSAREG